PGSYLFCDGFEDESGSNFSHWTTSLADNWHDSNPAPNLGTGITVDSSAICLGAHGLHTSTGGQNQEAIVIRNFDTIPTALHVPFFLYTKQHASGVGLVELRNRRKDFTSLWVDPPAAGGSSSRFGFESSFNTAVPNVGAALPLAHNQWLCVELTLRLDDTN